MRIGSFIRSFIWAIPFYFLWNHLAPIYLAQQIPEIYLDIPFKHVVGIFFLINIIKLVLFSGYKRADFGFCWKGPKKFWKNSHTDTYYHKT